MRRKCLSLLLLITSLLSAEAHAGSCTSETLKEKSPCVSAGSADVRAKTRGETRELRLGIVLYGGVSLAIYMHGQTRELQDLIIASRAHEAGVSKECLDGMVRVYYEALEKTARSGINTRVVIDSIAGTSAGGINGIFLAKALAHDQSQSSLRDLWMTRADIWQLLGGRVEGGFRLARLALGLPFGRAKAPLDGNAMFGWAYDALQGMGRECPDKSLVPPGERMRLFITTTDFRGRPRGFAIGEPPTGIEREHRKVLDLIFERRVDGVATRDPFSQYNDPLLAFAVRSTSSFPGAFPPIKLEDIRGNLPCATQERCVTEKQMENIRNLFFDEYGRDGADVNNTWFMDGGVLDNYPFGHVIEDLRGRAPAREVERRLVYLQPDPGGALEVLDKRDEKYLKTIWGALSTIARSEPIGDEFRSVGDFNSRVQLTRSVIERAGQPLDDSLMNDMLGLNIPFVAEESAGKSRDKAMSLYLRERASLPYDAYLELRAQSVVEQFGKSASESCQLGDSAKRTVLVAALREWADHRQLIGKGSDSMKQDKLRENLDVGFLWRQLRFLSDAGNELYKSNSGRESRAKLDEAQSVLATHIEKAHLLMRGEDISAEIQSEIKSLCRALDGWHLERSLDSSVSRFVIEYGDEMDVLYEQLIKDVGDKQIQIRRSFEKEYDKATRDWPFNWQDRVRRYYRGFPIWDVMVYPYQRLADAGEFQTIKIVRMSPDDAKALGKATAAQKLGGTKVAHFGAFLKRQRREQDYLWGRLDGAERILALLYGLNKSDEAIDPAGVPPDAMLRDAFTTIVNEEKEALPRAAKCIAALQRRLGSEFRLDQGDSPIPQECRVDPIKRLRSATNGT